MALEALLWHIKDREERSEWDALFIHSLIEWTRTKTGKRYERILDVPCGNGRIHPFLRKFNYRVEGFDISRSLVEEARERGNNCWAGDMRDPESYRGKYDIIVNWFSSFGYFNHEENVQVMENFYGALNEGGILLLDFPNFGNRELLRGGESVMRRGDNIEIMEEGAEGKVRKIRIRLFKDLGDKLLLEGELRQNLWAYTPEDLKEMAEDIGFEVHLFETYRTRPLSKDSRRVTLVGIK